MFPYPPTNGSMTGNAIYKRLQVHNTDLDPALENIGALYFVEGQYVTLDDATAGNNSNNASYRHGAGRIVVLQLSFSSPPPVTGSQTQREKAGIQAWQATDPAVVTETDVFVPNGTGASSSRRRRPPSAAASITTSTRCRT